MGTEANRRVTDAARISQLEARVARLERAVGLLLRGGRVVGAGDFAHDAERTRPHGGGRVTGRASHERTRPWGAGNT